MLALTAAATYLATTWHYRVGLFAANTIRDGRLQDAGGATWARPLSVEGLPNLHRVDDRLYRGAQPTVEGLASLRSLGVRTIVDLREHNEDAQIATASGLALRYIPLSALRAPSEESVVEFLKIAGERGNAPIFVHCRQGADRTGMMCALYRVAVQGWSKQDAIDEMTGGGFGYHQAFARLADYVRDADVQRLRRLAALPEP